MLVRTGLRLLETAWDVKTKTPAAMIGSLAVVPLPVGLPFDATEEGRKKLQMNLWEKHKIQISPSILHEGKIWIRISAQIYNDIGDYERLAAVVNGLRIRPPGSALRL